MNPGKLNKKSETDLHSKSWSFIIENKFWEIKSWKRNTVLLCDQSKHQPPNSPSWDLSKHQHLISHHQDMNPFHMRLKFTFSPLASLGIQEHNLFYLSVILLWLAAPQRWIPISDWAQKGIPISDWDSRLACFPIGRSLDFRSTTGRPDHARCALILLGTGGSGNGSVRPTVCGSYLVESTAGGGAAEVSEAQAGGPARHQRRPPPASNHADIVPDIQRRASGSRLRLSCTVSFFQHITKSKRCAKFFFRGWKLSWQSKNFQHCLGKIRLCPQQ